MPRFAPSSLLAFSLLLLISMSAARTARSHASYDFFAPPLVAGFVADLPDALDGAAPVRREQVSLEAHGAPPHVASATSAHDRGWQSLAGASRAVVHKSWRWETPTSLFFAISLSAAGRTGRRSPADSKRSPLAAPAGTRDAASTAARNKAAPAYFDLITDRQPATAKLAPAALGRRYGVRL